VADPPLALPGAQPHIRPVPNNTPNRPKFVTASEIARRYGVTSRYILQLATDGRIPCVRLGRKCVRFDAGAVATAIEGDAMTDS
jgi:excisionase family DNA binding protein